MGKRLEDSWTEEQRKLSSINHKNAWKYFYPEGNGVSKPHYHLHHKDNTLRYNNVDRYIEWRIEDLLMVTIEEHNSIHKSGFKHSENTKKIISSKVSGVNNGMYGKQRNEEFKAKLRGRHIYYDKNGQRFRLFETDPRVISKELVPLAEYRMNKEGS